MTQRKLRVVILVGLVALIVGLLALQSLLAEGTTEPAGGPTATAIATASRPAGVALPVPTSSTVGCPMLASPRYSLRPSGGTAQRFPGDPAGSE